MVRLTLVVITLVVISLMFMGISYGKTWYGEDFDRFKNGAIAGQKGWELNPLNPLKSPTIQEEVAFGDTGKSILVELSTYAVRHFPGAHADIQHVSFHFRHDSSTDVLMEHYIGGGDIKWEAAAHFAIDGGSKKLSALDGWSNRNIAIIELEKWLHFHVVLDFNSKTYDLYLDGEQVAKDFGFEGEADGIPNPSLDWFLFGRGPRDHDLVAYIDNISIGTGEGDPDMPPEMAVSSSGKLATTWAELKR